MNEENKIKTERQASIQCANELIAQGVYFRDPTRFDIKGSLVCGKNVEIDIYVTIEGTKNNDTHIGNGAFIYSGCKLVGSGKSGTKGDNWCRLSYIEKRSCI